MTRPQIDSELRRIAGILLEDPDKNVQAVGAILIATLGCMKLDQTIALHAAIGPFLKSVKTDLEIRHGNGG